jgi:hypothetical protein
MKEAGTHTSDPDKRSPGPQDPTEVQPRLNLPNPIHPTIVPLLPLIRRLHYHSILLLPSQPPLK